MDTRGTVYLVTARRNDQGWIHYRTCDRSEADAVAGRIGGSVSIDVR